MKRLWLHIGAPKTGTTALQHCFNQHREELLDAGLLYVTPRRKSSANSLAVALNKRRTSEIDRISDDLAAQVEETSGDALISSEMFYDCPPEHLLPGLPFLRPEITTLLVWIRRQDLYLESKFLQKSKNGRFRGSFDDYVSKFGGSGADYAAALSAWEAAGFKIEVRLPIRHIVEDALEILGLSDRIALPTPPPENTSPSRFRLELLQAAAAAGHPNPRRLQRRLPPDPSPKARILSTTERRRILENYAASNEVIRRRYFPDRRELFDESDLTVEKAADPPALSEAERDEITTLLKVFRETLS